jgi:hypothetical protein
VVEEPDAGGDLGAAGAVEIELERNLGLSGSAVNASGTLHN